MAGAGRRGMLVAARSLLVGLVSSVVTAGCPLFWYWWLTDE